MKVIKVDPKDAQEAKKFLMDNNYFAHGFKVAKENGALYFPVTEDYEGSYPTEDKELKATNHEKPSTLKSALAHKLPEDLLDQLKTTYDQVGDIAILEIDGDLTKYEKLIGETLLSINNKISTVLAKDAGHEGTFRTQKMRLLAGEDKRIAMHKENNTTLKIDVEEVYYSARLSTERKRISELVKPGEDILVMFSGCGPYTCVLSKNTKAASVLGVEINPEGHKLAEENIKLNKLSNAKTLCGDVKEVVPTLKQSFDRILMPLPKTAETFLDTAIQVAKPNATIHFYAFLHQDEFEQAHTWILEACKQAHKACTILQTTKCGQQSPYTFRICVDFTLE